MEAESLSLQKQELRRQIDGRLANLSDEQVVRASGEVCRRLYGLDCLREADHVAVYAAFGKEVRLTELVDALRQEGCQLYYPRFHAERRLYEMVAVEDPARDLQPGHWGLLEPPPGRPAISKDRRRFELTWLVPACAFDCAGRRLGRGAGYYDRMLAETHGMRIGVALHEQLISEVPVGPHDVAMNLVVTNQQTIVC